MGQIRELDPWPPYCYTRFMSEKRPQSFSEWTDYYLAREDWEAIDAVAHPHMGGDQLKGAQKSIQVRAEKRHRESMDAASTANKLGKAGLAVGLVSMILALIAIIPGCQAR